jgi:hypothetical protein
MPSTLTSSQASKLLRDVIKDYNFWGQSESDAPLSIKSAKVALDDKKILSVDASARKKVGESTPEILKARTILTEDFETTFQTLTIAALNTLTGKVASPLDIAGIASNAQELEFYTQLYSVFKQLDTPKIMKVDAPSDANVTLVICANSSDGVVYATAHLVQS